MSAKLEVSPKEAILAVSFVFLTMLAVALVQAGIVSNPLILGLLITLTVGLVFIGHILVRTGAISRSAVPLWYIFTFGLVMLLYGGIQAGYIPVAFVCKATIMEIAITNAVLYTLLVLAIVATVAVVYLYYQRRRYY